MNNDNDNIKTGTIININNKYVINNEMKFILPTPIVNTLLPYDIVEYKRTDTGCIEIIRLLKREVQYLFAIIKYIEYGYAHFFCPELPKFFSPQIPFENHFNIGSIAIIKVGMYSIELLKLYDNISKRINDKNIMLDLYKLRSESCKLIPNYNKYSNYFYSCEYKDVTHLHTFNVDPTNSKDFDDAISVDHENNKIYVHIVDAHEQIECDSEEDLNAFKSSFTLYLPEHVENILPRTLAEEKLSLIKGEERKVITVEFDINPENQSITGHKIYKSSIIIKERYDYEGFSKIVLDKYPQLVAFYKKWQRKTLDIPHIKLEIQKETGEMIGYSFESNNDIAHKIIETLMILTNMTVSTHVPFVIPQRYHQRIKSEFEVVEFSNNPIINAILTIKKYKPAIYDSEKEGHFGLELSSYTHFTSPIRRYFDVIIHRLLAGTKYDNLEVVLEHINKQEVQIEKMVKLYEKLKIMDYLEKNIDIIWKGYIINITKTGVVVLLEELAFEVFIFDCSNNYSLCDEVNVKITKINWITLNISAKFI